MQRLVIGLLGAGLALSGCQPAEAPALKEEAGGKADRWDFSNDPARFGLPLVFTLADLPREGRAARVPWSETYWPTTDDSFNHRWQGPRTLSPLEKYDLAFNGWQPPAGFMDLRPLTAESCASGAWDRAYYDQLGPAAKYWSRDKGVGRAINGFDDDGDGRVDECDDLDGMEHWWGSCHAWTPAAILEDEPLEPVIINGVKFEVSDLKALVILMYDESRQIAIGDRCELANPPRDASGRILDATCRNTNAGAFHLLMANLLGLQRRSFAEDRVSGREVWNQPLAAYRVTRQSEVDLATAIRLAGGSGDKYPHDPEAARFVEVEAELDYVVETHPSTQPTTPIIQQFVRTDRYHYLLELDAAGRIRGGEWLSGRGGNPVAANDRPDYLWLPLGPGKMPNPHVSTTQVRRLLRLSRPETRNLTVETYRDEVNQLIPDYPWGPLTRTLQVDSALTIQDVTVHVEALHDWAFDVQVWLRRGAERVLLFNRNPQGTSTQVMGSWSLPQLAGQPASGAWTLEVADREGRSVGRLLNWSLDITGVGTPPPEPPPAPAELRFSSQGEALAIPDKQPAGIASTIAVPADGVADSVEVTLAIAHPYRGDLRVALVHGGAEMVLSDRQGGAADDLRRSFPATLFAGAQMGGDWTLRVSDHASQDVGTLEGWSLTLRPRR
jgi:subtilisin-like proprotein convertase family protein